MNSSDLYYLFPDGDVAITVAGKTFNPSALNFTTNVYTATEWDNNFEAAGCVFLPGAGNRFKIASAGISNYGSCLYWTSTPYSSNPGSGAMGWLFNGSQAPYTYSQTRSTGALSLRLVQELH